METEDQETESIEGSTLHVVEDDAVTAQSSVSVRSRCSSLQDPNQGLLKYVAKLSSSPNLEDSLDLEYIKSLIREGASVNTCDRFGQTLLHEVSKTWGIEVAQFFIEQGRYCLCVGINFVLTSLHLSILITTRMDKYTRMLL